MKAFFYIFRAICRISATPTEDKDYTRASCLVGWLTDCLYVKNDDGASHDELIVMKYTQLERAIYTHTISLAVCK